MADASSLPKLSSDTFSLELYAQILKTAKSLNYDFPKVSDLKDGALSHSRFLLLRHDIDVSPRYALAMAQLEHSMGVCSSYYILLHSPYYNPAAPPHWDALREMVSLGFEVGLHYETNFFESRGLDPLQGILRDVKVLENILRIEIKSIAQHMPASSTLLSELNEHFVDAYNHDLMHNVRYISDSGFKWRGETLLDLLGKEDRIHALLHPATWTFGDLDMAQTYRRAGEEISSEIRASFEEFIESTNRHLAKREQLDAARKAQYLLQTRK